MDIHERQSAEPEYTWQHFNFFTVVVCGLGFIGNVSSLFVLLRHQKDIAGYRPLLALTVADLGVVLSIAWRTIAYYTTGYSQQTLTAEWICLYWYYCSIYFTILLSVDRCLSSAYPMLLLKIDYTKLQRRIIGAVFPAVFLITLPHLLGSTVTYHHGSHSMTAYCSHKDELCNLLSHRAPDNDVPWEIVQCGNLSGSQTLSTSKALKLEHIPQMVDTWCNSTTESNSSMCKPVRTPADKFTPHLVVGLGVSGIRDSNGTWVIQRLFLSVCNSSTPTNMRHDPDFVKAVYLGIDLPLRYIIPCLALVAINIRLLVAVFQAQKRHKQIIGDTSPVSLLDLPVLKSVGAIILVFAFCHTGGVGMYITDVIRAFYSHALNTLTGNVAMFLDENSATHALLFRYTAYFLSAVNSSINVILYCLYLPTFRQYWKKLFGLCVGRRKGNCQLYFHWRRFRGCAFLSLLLPPWLSSTVFRSGAISELRILDSDE